MRAAVILVLLATAAYANSLNAPFVYDDLTTIHHNHAVRFFSLDLKQFLNTRSLLYPTYAFNEWLNGENVFGYHAVNLLLHVVNGLLVFAIARRIYRKLELSLDVSTCALFAAAFFLVHPIQTEAVTYITERSELLSKLPYLLGLLFFASLPENKIGFFASIPVLMCLVLGIGFKETAVTLPAAIVLYDYMFISKSSIRKLLSHWRFYLGLTAFVGAGAYALFDVLLRPVVAVGAPGTLHRWYFFLTALRAVARYLRLIVFPTGQNLDYDFPPSLSPKEPAVLLSAGLILGLLVLAWLWRKRKPVYSFSIFWFFITIAPLSSIVPIPDVIAEHRLYLSLAGVAFSFPLLLQTVGALYGAVKKRLNGWVKSIPLLVRRGGCTINKNAAKPPYSAQTGWSLANHSETWLESDHPGRSRKEASQHFLDVAATPPHEEGTTQARQGAASIVARSQENRPRLQLLGSVVVAVLLILTVARNYVWADEFRLFSDVVTKSPHKLRAYENLIFAHMKRGQEDQAIRVASLAIQNVTFVEQVSLLDTIGNLYLRMQRPPDAIEYFKQSNYVALRLPSPGAYFLATSFNNLGAAYLALAKTYDTRHAGERAQALHHAREAFEKSLQQESSVAVLGSLVNVSQQLGEASIFEAQLRKNLAGNPNEFNSLYMLAELLSLEDRYQESLEYFRRAEEQNKQSEVLRFNYAFALSKAGQAERAIEEYLQALRLDPIFHEAHYNLAMLYVQKADYDSAVRHLNAIVSLEAANVKANMKLAEIYAYQGNVELARQYLQQVLKADPQDREALSLFARIGG